MELSNAKRLTEGVKKYTAKAPLCLEIPLFAGCNFAWVLIFICFFVTIKTESDAV